MALAGSYALEYRYNARTRGCRDPR
ncbi:MAG: hypothetical protein QOD65_119, partial [Gaiellales bacterium]|nr:hypothetical protein [Gaiellales bacterium]